MPFFEQGNALNLINILIKDSNILEKKNNSLLPIADPLWIKFCIQP